MSSISQTPPSQDAGVVAESSHPLTMAWSFWWQAPSLKLSRDPTMVVSLEQKRHCYHAENPKGFKSSGARNQRQRTKSYFFYYITHILSVCHWVYCSNNSNNNHYNLYKGQNWVLVLAKSDAHHKKPQQNFLTLMYNFQILPNEDNSLCPRHPLIREGQGSWSGGEGRLTGQRGIWEKLTQCAKPATDNWGTQGPPWPAHPSVPHTLWIASSKISPRQPPSTLFPSLPYCPRPALAFFLRGPLVGRGQLKVCRFTIY